jgi:formylglycine-generating enzyme required for sulfatase activity
VSGRAAESVRPRATARVAASVPGKESAKTARSGTGTGTKKRAKTAGTKHEPKANPKRVARAGRPSTRPAAIEASVWSKLNDPALGQVEGALAQTGAHPECVNGYGVYDMVGNLHEWVATDPATPHGTFAGGYYLDTAINGDGCGYRTVAHAHEYHDYSTGFRCCAATR